MASHRLTTLLARCPALLLCALVLAACGASSSDKAGGTPAPDVTVLTFANSGAEAEYFLPFIAAVERLSGGTLMLDVKNDWRIGEPGFEEGLIEDVRAGKADLGWVGSRAFDDLDVRAFDALHAPLLIENSARGWLSRACAHSV
jgi:ABC-type glycerol-3-phosphate transport system substrate-binding protein